MAAIALTDCTVSATEVGGYKFVKIVTPATADDGDTIDCSSLFNVSCWALVVGATDKGLLGTTAATTITLPGATDNEARTILAIGS